MDHDICCSLVKWRGAKMKGQKVVGADEKRACETGERTRQRGELESVESER